MLFVAARGFKALKQVVKLHYKLGNHNEMLQAYRSDLCTPMGGHGHTDNHMQAMVSWYLSGHDCLPAMGCGR